MNLVCAVIYPRRPFMPVKIGKYGVMGTPALVINKKVVSVGTTPDKKKIRQWLEEAIRQMQTGTA